MSKHTFRTTININAGGWDLCDLTLIVAFTFTPGTPATYYDPGCGDSASIQAVTAENPKTKEPVDLPDWIVGMIEASDTLAIDLIDHAIEDATAAEDEHADFQRRERRDERMLEA